MHSFWKNAIINLEFWVLAIILFGDHNYTIFFDSARLDLLSRIFGQFFADCEKINFWKFVNPWKLWHYWTVSKSNKKFSWIKFKLLKCFKMSVGWYFLWFHQNVRNDKWQFFWDILKIRIWTYIFRKIVMIRTSLF